MQDFICISVPALDSLTPSISKSFSSCSLKGKVSHLNLWQSLSISQVEISFDQWLVFTLLLTLSETLSKHRTRGYQSNRRHLLTPKITSQKSSKISTPTPLCSLCVFRGGSGGGGADLGVGVSTLSSPKFIIGRCLLFGVRVLPTDDWSLYVSWKLTGPQAKILSINYGVSLTNF